jgi:hypothetical protein
MLQERWNCFAQVTLREWKLTIQKNVLGDVGSKHLKVPVGAEKSFGKGLAEFFTSLRKQFPQ